MQEPQYIKINSYYNKFYYKDKAMTILHRVDGPAIEYAAGSKSWYVDGKLHRVDGPAYECSSGTNSWYVNNKLHRVDGPAIESPSGYKAWYVDGNPLSETEFNRRTAKETILTFDEIAAKFNVDVRQLKIAKEH